MISGKSMNHVGKLFYCHDGEYFSSFGIVLNHGSPKHVEVPKHSRVLEYKNIGSSGPDIMFIWEDDIEKYDDFAVYSSYSFFYKKEE